jgi:predicted acetyltransferase
MAIQIRTIGPDRVDDYLRAVWRGFHDPHIEQADLEGRRERYLEGRWWAALDGDAIVATVRTLPLDTTLPGGATPVSCGVTAVTTAATHRRRGLMARMMTAALADGRERGEPLTTLIAAEYPIYGRFGYGPGTEHVSYKIHTGGRWLAEGVGTVELVDADTLLAEAPAVYDAHRLASPSEISRDAFGWRIDVLGDPSKPRRGFQAICRDAAGGATGYVMYTIDKAWEGRRPTNTLVVEALVAASPAAEARLWRHVCEVDWVRTVTAENRSVDERLPWWLENGRDVVQTERADLVWARPLDVTACLSQRTYAAPFAGVIEVVDPIGLSGGRFRVRTDGGAGACEPTTASADLTLPIAALGSVLFGGHSLRTLAEAGRADEHVRGALRAADVALRGEVAPWSISWF